MGLCNLGPRPTITLIKTFSLSFSSKKKRRNPIRRVRNKIVNQSMIIGVLDQRKQSCLTLKYYEIIPGDYNPGNWNGTRPRLYWLHQDPIFRILLNITVKTLNDKTERWDYGQAQKLHGIQMSNEASCELISFRCIPIKNHMWNHPCISILKVLHNYRFTDLQKILHQEKLKTCQPFHDWWNRQC